MFKRVIFSRFTPKYIITMLYAIDVSDLPENAWHHALDVEWTCNVHSFKEIQKCMQYD